MSRRPLLLLCAPLALGGCTEVLEYYSTAPDASADTSPTIVLPSPDAGCGTPDDSDNCGVCGHSCLGGVCTNGVCQPVILASGQGLSSPEGYYAESGASLTGPDSLAVDETYVYWLNLRGEVMRVPLGGGTPARLASTLDLPSFIGLDATSVYFSTLETYTIFRIPKTGGTPYQLTPYPPSGFGLDSFAIYDGALYWADGVSAYRCPTSGCAGGATDIWDEEQGSPDDVTVGTDGTLYLATSFTATDGGAPTFDIACPGLASAVDGPSIEYYAMQADSSHVFALSEGAVVEGSCTGVNSLTFLASGTNVPLGPVGLAIDSAYAYWVQPTGMQTKGFTEATYVERCAKSGCASPEILTPLQESARAIAVDDVAVYWTTGDGDVKRLAKPGAATTQYP